MEMGIQLNTLSTLHSHCSGYKPHSRVSFLAVIEILLFTRASRMALQPTKCYQTKLSQEWSGQSVKLTTWTQICLVLTLRVCTTILPFLHTPSWHNIQAEKNLAITLVWTKAVWHIWRGFQYLSIIGQWLTTFFSKI